MRWHSRRPRALITQLGEARVARAYWHCPACGRGAAPADAAWDLPPGQASWGVRAWASWLGALIPSFLQATAVLDHLTPVRVSARALEGWTEEVGAAYTLPEPAPVAPGPPADLLLLEVDGGQAHFADGWHEVKVAAAWARMAGSDQPVCYATVQGPWARHEDVLTALVARAGGGAAPRMLCLADGDRAHWRVLERLCPDADYLLDWYHLQEHLGDVVKACGLDAAWLAAQQTVLREHGPQATLRALVTLARQPGWTADQAEGLRQCLVYLWHNRHRMDYAAALRRGDPIGSGRIESAIKRVLQARAKGPGMRWAHDHLQAVLNARCAVLNGDWDVACAQTRAAARTLPPGARPLAPPYRLRVPTAGAPTPDRGARRTRRTFPNNAEVSTPQLARVVRQAFGLR